MLIHDVQLVQDPARTDVNFQEPFFKEPPTNAIMISVVEYIQRMGSVLTRGKECTGCPATICTNKNHGRYLHQVFQSFRY